jgi:hypothetical protein
VSVETPPSPPEQPAAKRCPRCGAAMTEQQEWCLSCGTAVGTRVVAAPGWRTPIAIAGVILALAAIAVAVAIVQLADDTDEVTPNAAVTGTPTPLPTATPDPALAPGGTLPEASGQATPEPTRTPEPTTTPESTGSADAEWPEGESGWTVVLASDPSESDARARAEELAADGIAGVGVLDSDGFSTLKRGLWIVFAGRYDSQSEASDALDGIDAKDAYIRRIEPA